MNLSLDILGQLPNGYHLLRSVVHTVALWDQLDITWLNSDQEVHFTCSRADLNGPNNLVLKAVQTFASATGEPVGASIHLTKNIPSGAGLGGGSGNAAAMLVALNQRTRQPLQAAQLSTLGQLLGADVPLFLVGGALVMEGIGEKISPLPPLHATLLILKPPLCLGTPQIYRAWDTGGHVSCQGSESLLAHWPPAPETLGPLLTNDLERAAADAGFHAEPYLRLLLDSGALGARMTGSGSACFGVFESRMAADAGLEVLSSHLNKWDAAQRPQVYLAPLCPKGVELVVTG